jgi:hypothetical protein
VSPAQHCKVFGVRRRREYIASHLRDYALSGVAESAMQPITKGHSGSAGFSPPCPSLMDTLMTFDGFRFKGGKLSSPYLTHIPGGI